MDQTLTAALLADGRPETDATTAAPLQAVEIINPGGQAPVLLICDHAGRRIPGWLGDLGLPERERARHIGWDPGAADMTRVLAKRLDAPAVLCHVSRLVIDPNRKPGEPTSIPRVSDGTVIPANQHVSADDRRRRYRLSFLPYQRTVARMLARLRARVRHPAIVSVHTCTDVMGGLWRPWHVGVLFNHDQRLALPVLDALRRDRALLVGANQPYSGRIHNGYTVPFHAERTRLPHVTFEVRQDLLRTDEQTRSWGDRLAEALALPLAESTLYRAYEPEPCR